MKFSIADMDPFPGLDGEAGTLSKRASSRSELRAGMKVKDKLSGRIGTLTGIRASGVAEVDFGKGQSMDCMQDYIEAV